jgi:protein-S-isoprenylcysteine O-methyltransferase Ste14
MQKGALQAVVLVVNIGAICAAALAYAGMLALSRMPPASFKEVDLPAWVQAVGLVLAMLASAGTVWWAHYLEKRHAQAADSQRHHKWRRFCTTTS